MSSERKLSAKTELRAATLSLMSSLDRGRSHLNRYLDSLRAGPNAFNVTNPVSYNKHTMSSRTRYSVQEGDRRWGGRILNPGPESRSPSLTSPAPRRRKRHKSGPKDQTFYKFQETEPLTTTVKSRQRTVPCRCFAIVPSPATATTFTGTEDTLARAEPVPPALSSSSPDIYLKTSPAWDDGLLARMRSSGNARRKSVSYVRGSSSFASAVPDLTPTPSSSQVEDDDDATAAPESELTSSAAESVRSMSLVSDQSSIAGRLSEGTFTLGSGVLPADPFWNTRPRTLLGYDFIAGCLDNVEAMAGQGALDWPRDRSLKLLREWNPAQSSMIGRKKKEDMGRRSSSVPRDSQRTSGYCLHRYRLEADDRTYSADRRNRMSSPSRRKMVGKGVPDGWSSEPEEEDIRGECRLCRLLVREKSSRSPCYHSCSSDIPTEGVAQRLASKSSVRTSCKSDMTFRPESLALSQNCSGREASGSTARPRASSLPLRSATRWRV